MGSERRSTEAAVLEDVRAFFGMDEEGEEVPLDEDSDGHGTFDAPAREFVDAAWFDFSYLAPDREWTEVEWAWVHEPFAYVSILYDERSREHRYHVVEPTLDEFEQFVKEDIITVLRGSLPYLDIDEDDDQEAVFTDHVLELVREHAATVDDGTLHKVLYYVTRDFLHFGPIDPIMRDPGIEDISADGVDVPVYVYHRDHRDLATNVSFDRTELNSFAVRLAQRSKKQLSISEPLIDASLPDGSRIQLTFGDEVSTRGTNFTIRKFADIPYTPVDLINWNTFSIEQMAYFWLAIENNKSLVFAGGTGSGKTTSMNAVSFFVPPSAKVVSIEDTREITLPHQNWVQSVTRDSFTADGRGGVSMYNLLQAALRQRPEYILVGEIRTEQNVALTFFQAIGTGHTAYTTIHAESVEGVLNRLENPPLSVPTQMIQDLDIVSIQSQTYEDGRRVRRNREVTELLPPTQGSQSVRVSEVFHRDPETDTHERVNDSQVLQEVADDRGWSRGDLARALKLREQVLAYLIENEITGYTEVATTIHLFQKDQELVVEEIEDGTFDPTEYMAAVLGDPTEGEELDEADLEETWEQVLAAAETDPESAVTAPEEFGEPTPTSVATGDGDSDEAVDAVDDDRAISAEQTDGGDDPDDDSGAAR